ncbi:hypothetical protein MRX96_010336 [Rhipicephalus microplus]
MAGTGRAFSPAAHGVRQRSLPSRMAAAHGHAATRTHPGGRMTLRGYIARFRRGRSTSSRPLLLVCRGRGARWWPRSRFLRHLAFLQHQAQPIVVESADFRHRTIR